MAEGTNARRGYVPDDARNFSAEGMKKLAAASRHVAYLINEGYDLKQSVTFAGNHFLLSERQRLALTRSLAARTQLENRERKRKSSEELCGKAVWIDGFNTVITLEVLLSNSILLEGMDGAIRDLASLRGTYKIIPETEGAIRLLMDVLSEAGAASANILLDEPISNSGRLKTLIAQIAESYPITMDIRILKDVDRALYEKENVITSDSIILDHCRSWFNLTERCMAKRKRKALCVWKEDGGGSL